MGNRRLRLDFSIQIVCYLFISNKCLFNLKGAYDSVLGNLKDYVKYQQVKDNHIKKIITTRTRLSNIIKKDFESIPNSKIINAAGAGKL